MKRLKFLFVILFIIAAVVSCDKDLKEKNYFGARNPFDGPAVEQSMDASEPISNGGVTPYIIPGVNPGGNRTCAEVAAAWGLDPNPFLCGNKIDFNYGAFAGTFPSGLNVSVENGKYVTFSMDDCILIGDKYYKVGAVIVKGSNNANVYYYPEGTLSDGGLASPENASGRPAGLSNLTFCFVECKELVMAAKVFYTLGDRYSAAESSGDYIFSASTEWCRHLGINYYPNISVFKLLDAYTRDEIGRVEVIEVANSLKVTFTLNEGGLLGRTYLYVGDLAGIQGSDLAECPNYQASPWLNKDNGLLVNSYTFEIPY